MHFLKIKNTEEITMRKTSVVTEERNKNENDKLVGINDVFACRIEKNKKIGAIVHVYELLHF